MSTSMVPFDITDVELDDLAQLTRHPSAWPAEHRQALPAVRALVTRWQAARAEERPASREEHDDLSTAAIARRIGAHE